MEVEPLEEATPAESASVDATPAGATPREDLRIEERCGDASPMEEVSEGGPPMEKVAEEASFGEANEATTRREGREDQPGDNVVERQIGAGYSS